MSSFDCEGHIAKDEQVPTTTTTNDQEPQVSTTTNALVVETVTETNGTTTQVEMVEKPVETTTTTIVGTEQPAGKSRFFNVNFRQKTRTLRDMWTHQQKLMELNRDHTQLVLIIVIVLIAIICSVTALLTNSWTCNARSNMYFGLWNTCYMQVDNAKTNATTMTMTMTTMTTTTTGAVDMSDNMTNGSSVYTNRYGTVCARQDLHDVNVMLAEKSRIDQISASQGLIVCGTSLYVFSLVTMLLAFKFIHANNLNSVRNALVASMCVQIVSFLMQLAGFFLFILTERLSISVTLLFIYFALAIFATNIINFITIEYKTFKMRHLAM